MSESIKIKIEPTNNEIIHNKNIEWIVNIKQEPEVSFELILPPVEVKSDGTTEFGKLEQNSNKLQCKQCLKEFREKKNLRKHEIQVHVAKVKCPVCSMDVHKRNMKKHLKIHEDSRGFTCYHCNVKFSLKAHLYLHNKKLRLRNIEPKDEPNGQACSDQLEKLD
jgi:hypothetical protein